MLSVLRVVVSAQWRVSVGAVLSPLSTVSRAAVCLLYSIHSDTRWTLTLTASGPADSHTDRNMLCVL